MLSLACAQISLFDESEVVFEDATLPSAGTSEMEHDITEMPAAELTLAHVEMPSAIELGSAELPSFSEAFFAAFSGEPPPVVAGGGGGSVGSRARAGLVRSVDV